MKWTRQRCHVAPSTLATAAFSPSWASEVTSFTPRRPRRASERRNSTQPFDKLRRLGLAVDDRHAEHLAPPVGVDTDGDDDRDRDDVVIAPCLDVGGVEPDIGPLALDRATEEGLHPLVDLAAQPRYLALANAFQAHRTHQIVDRAGRDALDVGFLDDCCQRLLGQAAGLEKGREVAAAAQLRDAQLDGAGAGLPVSLAVAVALVAPIGAALTGPGAAQALGLQRHQALGRKADHLAQECYIRALLQQRAKGDLVFGHRGDPRVRVACRNTTLPKIATVAAARPAGATAKRLASAGRSTASYTTIRDTTPFSLPAVARKKLTAAFDGGRLTSDGGVLLLAAVE